MTTTIRPRLKVITVAGICLLLLVGCERKTTMRSDQYANGTARKFDWEKVKRDNEERLRNPHPSDWPLPNYECGPGRPLPILVNFYRIDDHYPTYLLCSYNVDEKQYSQTQEPKWFQSAIEQIRRSGPKEFPPIKWVAIMIVNRADGAEQCCKVGAIFKAEEVFDPSQDLAQLVAHAEMDRHPFMYDKEKPTPGEQQRWLIVEQHSEANVLSRGLTP